MNETITTAITSFEPTGPKALARMVATGSVSSPARTFCMSGTARISARHANIAAAPPMYTVMRMALGMRLPGFGVSSATSPQASKP
ncbi:hypothetical protein D9M71_535100 [compost metagenome]